MKKLLFLILIIILVIYFVPKSQERQEGQSDKVEAGITPGDILYFLDKSWEWSQLNLFTFTDKGKLKLRIKFVDERLAELEELQRKKELTEERAKKFMEDYNSLVSDVNKNIEKVQSGKDDLEDLVVKMKDISDRQKTVMNDISLEAPKKTSEWLLRISELSGDLYKKTENIFK